jgi:isopentenyl-diphosphate delta-isomerase
MQITSTKLKHVQACLRPESQYSKSAGFDRIELEHQAAAGLNLCDIALTTNFLGYTLKAPLMIAPMTGGMELGARLNERWAKAAEHFGLAFGVGSQRIALERPEARPSFMIRRYAPSTLLFANLGASQLLKSVTSDHALKAVEMIEANALFIHLNPLQELCQRDGDRDFAGILDAITQIVARLHKHKIPVLVREVGFGLSEQATKDLLNCGVAGLDCSGAGGTSWAKVEALCADTKEYQHLGELFGEWGIPTAQSIKNVRAINKTIPLIASGGIRSGLDIAKALKLGANIAAIAQPCLVAGVESEEALFAYLEQIIHELRVALFAAGMTRVCEL